MKDVSPAAEEHLNPTVVSLHNARTLHWPSRTRVPELLLLFIPGNPGLCDQCCEYLSELYRLIDDDGKGTSIEIYCPSQLGHDPLSEHQPTSQVTLDEQIQNKAEILSTILLTYPTSDRPRVVLGGHSIGTWMALEMIRRDLCKVHIDSLHLLFPTIHQLDQMPNARIATRFFRAADYHRQNSIDKGADKPALSVALTSAFITLALYFLNTVPYAAVNFFVRRDGPNMPSSSIKATTMMLRSPACARQALCMAYEQLSAVQEVQPIDLKSTSGAKSNELDTKLRLYWAADDIDGWAPSKARNVVDSTLQMQNYDLSAPEGDGKMIRSRASIACSENIPHAFFLKNSIEMAELTAKMMKADERSCS